MGQKSSRKHTEEEAHKCAPLRFFISSSPIGEVGVVLTERDDGTILLSRVILPPAGGAVKDVVVQSVPTIEECSVNNKNIYQRIDAFFPTLGKKLPDELFDLRGLLAFEKKVLMATMRIPRGSVMTYGEVARVINHPRSARAVGNALACNPLPLVIPCHRVICSDGRIGRYQCGAGKKRQLLEWEGVSCNSRGYIETKIKGRVL